uniref:Uncharacterized protein n=1 Tax=Rangifer tarandus platyrhynchus TaxID=3082113 RepID=A0ACB0F7C6_RANTA|nr:unnamed protein product [Rangifer tarandus platyrhynchus]
MAFSCGSLGSHRASSPLSPAGQDCTRLDLALEEGPQALPLGQERGEGRPWVGSPTAGVLAEREGESLRRRLALCLDDFLRTRQAPLWSLPFPASTALCTRRAPRPLPSTSRAARCPLPVAAPARDLRPVLSDCSLSPRSINTSFSRREGRGPVRLLTETGKRRAVGHCHTQAQGIKQELRARKLKSSSSDREAPERRALPGPARVGSCLTLDSELPSKTHALTKQGLYWAGSPEREQAGFRQQHNIPYQDLLSCDNSCKCFSSRLPEAGSFGQQGLTTGRAPPTPISTAQCPPLSRRPPTQGPGSPPSFWVPSLGPGLKCAQRISPA